MPDRIFRLMERLQRIDRFLRSAQLRRVPDPLEVMRLRLLKSRTKASLTALAT